MAGTPETSLHYLGLPSQPGTASETEAACRQFGGARPASLHTTSDYRTLLRAAEQAAARMDAHNSNTSGSSSAGGMAAARRGPYVFWLFGVHNASSSRISWLDGTGYVLPVNFSVTVRGGCTAVVVTNGTAGLATRACTEQGAPVCAVYAPGEQQSRLSCALLCATLCCKGGPLTSPAQGRLSQLSKQGVKQLARRGPTCR